MMFFDTDGLANIHWHGREAGPTMRSLIRYSITGGASILGPQPNTKQSLTTECAGRIVEYIRRAEDMAQGLIRFVPFAMITEQTTEAGIDACVKAGVMDGKVYPFDRTTQSQDGVRDYARILSQVRHCGKVGMRVHFHPEHPWMHIINRDAEYMFVPIMDMFMQETAKEHSVFFWEHGTDGRCVPFWKEWAFSGRLYVTLTAHHLVENEDGAYGDNGSVCKPPIKPEPDRSALVSLVEENHPWVMAGLDDAYHSDDAKLPEVGKCSCGGFTTPYGLALYAHGLRKLFKSIDGASVFRNFTSGNMRKAYGLTQYSSRKVRLVQKPFVIPKRYPVGGEQALPFWAGRTIDWSIDG